MSRYFVSSGDWGDATIYDTTGDRPRAVVRKCDVSDEAWGLLLDGMGAANELTAAEQVVARLDSYSQEQHLDGINAARERARKRKQQRKDRAAATARRLRGEIA